MLIFFAEKMLEAFALQKLLIFIHQKGIVLHKIHCENVSCRELTRAFVLKNWALNAVYF